MGRSKTGQAVPKIRLTVDELGALTRLHDEAKASGKLDVWLRTRAVLAYIKGTRTVDIAGHLEVGHSSVRDWIRWYAREGAAGLTSAKPGRCHPKLTPAQREELAALAQLVWKQDRFPEIKKKPRNVVG